MLDRNLLLPLAAVAVEGFTKRRVSAGKLVCLVEILATSLEGCDRQSSPAIAIHRSVMRSDELHSHHAFKLVALYLAHVVLQ